MSRVLKICELIKSAALFTLCSLVMFASVPARADDFMSATASQAAQSPDVVADFNKLLSDAGLGILEAYGIILVVILVLAFNDGSNRRRDEAREEEARRTDSAVIGASREEKRDDNNADQG